MHQAISSARNNQKKLEKYNFYFYIFFLPSSPNFGRTTFVKQGYKKTSFCIKYKLQELETKYVKWKELNVNDKML